MKPKLPRDVMFHHDLHLLVWKPRGVINERAVNTIIAFLAEIEATSREPFNRFTDTCEAPAVDLTFRYVFHVSLFRRLSYAGRPPVKSAILVNSDEKAQYTKMHQILTEGSPLKVRIFEERNKAAKWLGVSNEMLEY